ncbi:MAG: type II toxin-antitoxin system VapC family toxin [Waddliaceae bacterium]
MDTNVLVALLDAKDIHHKRAVGLVTSLEDEQRDLLLADCIVGEVYTVFARRCVERNYSFSEVVSTIKNQLESIETLKAYPLVNEIHNGIVELMVQTNGRLNYHDALIAIVMRERRIESIATFDEDFKEIYWIRVQHG